MTTKPTTHREPWSRAISSDLTRCVGDSGLLKLVLDAVQTVDESRFATSGKRPEFRPQMMLTLLAYCYCSTLYGSHDIETAIGQDRTVRYICARTYPDWLSIQRFRRRNRDLLQQCLVYVFQQTWVHKFDEGEADYIGYDWFESELIEQVNAAAWERLDLAVLLDSVENDY